MKRFAKQFRHAAVQLPEIPHPAHITRREAGHIRVLFFQELRSSHRRALFRAGADDLTDLAVQLHLRQIRVHDKSQCGKHYAVIHSFSDIHMPYYFMRDTPLQALEQLMMSQPGQKPRGGGIYRSPFHYTPKDVACEYCQNYDRKHPCRLCECTCLEERIEAGVLELNEFVQECFAPSMGPQLRKRMHQQFREKKPRFFLSDAHRRRWIHWRERCWRLSDRNKAALFLLTAYESLWRRMVWKCGNDGFDFQSVRLGGIEPELYSVYQAAKAIAVGCCNITLADLASPELVTDEAFHLITGALLMAKYGDAVLNLEKGVDET